MTEEQVKIIREDYFSYIKENAEENGEIGAHIAVFADVKNDKDSPPALVEIPIPGEYLKDDDTKEHFVEKVLPLLIKEFQELFIAHTVIWVAEAWIRTAPKEGMDSVENYKDFPIKTEAVVLVIDSKDDTECIIYEMQRPSLSISSTGELVEKEQKKKVNLVEMPSFGGSMKETFGGRFSNLYKKFTENNDE
jgi:hypothetical protein